jgi:hypothetical protein
MICLIISITIVLCALILAFVKVINMYFKFVKDRQEIDSLNDLVLISYLLENIDTKYLVDDVTKQLDRIKHITDFYRRIADYNDTDIEEIVKEAKDNE